MKIFLLSILISLILLSTSEAQNKIKEFKAGQPAKAEEVNQNFTVLRDAINQLVGDHSDLGYIRIGNLQACWGIIVVGQGKNWIRGSDLSYVKISRTITFKKPFQTSPVITLSAIDGGIARRSAYVSYYKASNNGIAEIYLSSPNINAEADPVTLYWIALGTWK